MTFDRAGKIIHFPPAFRHKSSKIQFPSSLVSKDGDLQSHSLNKSLTLQKTISIFHAFSKMTIQTDFLLLGPLDITALLRDFFGALVIEMTTFQANGKEKHGLKTLRGVKVVLLQKKIEIFMTLDI